MALIKACNAPSIVRADALFIAIRGGLRSLWEYGDTGQARSNEKTGHGVRKFRWDLSPIPNNI